MQDSFDKSEDPIHVVNVCIKCNDLSVAEQGKQIDKFQEILQSRVSNCRLMRCMLKIWARIGVREM